jgi:hypothetical protein
MCFYPVCLLLTLMFVLPPPLLLLLLLQLTKERRDLVTHLRSDVIARIRDMPGPVALHVLGELNDLPRGWQAGLAKQQPAQHLAAVAARAEAHARDVYRGSSSTAAGGAWGDGGYGEGDGVWVTAGKEAGRAGVGSGPNSSSSNGLVVGSSSSSSAAGVPGTPAGLMAQLQSRRPDIWNNMYDRHKNLIRPLTAEQQKKVCVGLGAQFVSVWMDLLHSKRAVHQHVSGSTRCGPCACLGTCIAPCP